MNAAPSDASAFKVRPQDSRVNQCLKDYPSEIFGERLYQSIELMERYSIELGINLIGELNILDQIEDWKSPDALCRALRFQPRFSSAVAWLLDRLIETDCIEVRSDGNDRQYRLRRRPWASETDRLHDLAIEIDPGNAATLDLLDHAASIYPIVARGEKTGEKSLFGPKGIGLWLNYFHNGNLTYAVNNWVASVLAADRISSRPGLRILEIGAGAGSATQNLLQWFDRIGLLGRIERYLVTEPNAFFRRRAQRELTSRYPNVPLDWGTLDLNQPWRDQLAASDQFDLVYAVNVFHISKDLLFTLNQAGAILAPDGWLVIGECVRPYPDQPIYPEMMFQNLESFSDVNTEPEIRPRPGFLTPEQWRRAFSRSGYTGIHIAPDVEKIREFYPHFFTGAICGQRASSI